MEQAVLLTDGDQPGLSSGSSRPAGWKRHWQAGLVLVLVLAVTAVLAISARTSYLNSETRLTKLQTRLTAQLLQTAQPQLQATLGRVVGLAAASSDPVGAFQAAISSQIAPKGSFAAAGLAVVQNGQVRVLAHAGAPSISALTSQQTQQLYMTAARSPTLITTRVVSGKLQRIGYLLSAQGPGGTYVVGASQQLPAGYHVTVPANSPVSNLNFALYFGPKVAPGALLETDAKRLPLSGTVAKASAPLGNNVLTLVASPKSSLAGKWSEYLPWGILVAGLLLALMGAALTDRLVRRRRFAESAATASEELYHQQRDLSLSLQRVLLPKTLPVLPGFEAAARYVPAAKGAEIGGDWYSVVGVDDHRFAVVIGDVSGHGIAASGTMASLRYSIRALARLGFSPDDLLHHTSQDKETGLDDQFATALVGVVDTQSNEISIASAGHLPPLVIRNGASEFLQIAPGRPLGVDGPPPKLARATFSPGSTLVFFTDGLVEKRGESLYTGLERLAAVAAEGPTDPGELIEHILGSLIKADHEDDIAVLAIRFSRMDSDPSLRDPSPEVTTAGAVNRAT